MDVSALTVNIESYNQSLELVAGSTVFQKALLAVRPLGQRTIGGSMSVGGVVLACVSQNFNHNPGGDACGRRYKTSYPEQQDQRMLFGWYRSR